jgi:hypothetical protein
VPVAFPSHQGLILPLWRRFPRQIDAVALSVGAAMPDVIDTAAWPIRGQLGQLFGHSLLGVVVACVPVGVALTWLVRRFVPQRFLARLDDGATRLTIARTSVSVLIGALSHVVFDFVTHANFLLLWPWYEDDHFFPSWWSRPWATIPLPVYREPYPLAPHTIAWGALTIVGAVLFFRCLLPKR